ncbi:hypothetical protein GEMRC1_007795 [Eukaryota sp. GEM-RC1]
MNSAISGFCVSELRLRGTAYHDTFVTYLNNMLKLSPSDLSSQEIDFSVFLDLIPAHGSVDDTISSEFICHSTSILTLVVQVLIKSSRSKSHSDHPLLSFVSALLTTCYSSCIVTPTVPLCQQSVAPYFSILSDLVLPSLSP